MLRNDFAQSKQRRQKLPEKKNIPSVVAGWSGARLARSRDRYVATEHVTVEITIFFSCELFPHDADGPMCKVVLAKNLLKNRYVDRYVLRGVGRGRPRGVGTAPRRRDGPEASGVGTLRAGLFRTLGPTLHNRIDGEKNCPKKKYSVACWALGRSAARSLAPTVATEHVTVEVTIFFLVRIFST